MALPTLSGLTSLPYGTNADNSLGSSFANATVDVRISSAAILVIANAANAERVRRGTAAITIPAGYFTGVISASRIQAIVDAFRIAGPGASSAYNGAWQGYNSPDGQYDTGGRTPQYDNYGNLVGYAVVYAALPSPQTITYAQTPASSGAVNFNPGLVGSKIRAYHINTIIYELGTAMSVCTCNCNYCTCNCNYCTCNCNYACTCNCNYSDELVKTEIEYM
jgi:hypothetical protein